MKSKSDIEMARKLLKKQEESECKKNFRTNPVPAFVFLPLYHDIVKQNEERRRSMKEKNKEALLASQKPFKFIAREEQKQAIWEKQLKDFFKSKKKTNRFKAGPIPRSTCGSTINGKLMEEELCRNIRTQQRTQDFLQNSFPLPCSLARRSYATRKPKCPEQAEKSKCKHKNTLALSVSKVQVTSKKYKCTKPVPCSFNPPMPTVSSRGREQATRKSEKERMRDYQRELVEREEKLKNRPLLFERVAQKNARMAAEKHYSNTLKALGISDEFVSEKGQSGKIFEYFSNQKMKSFTEDKESFNEEEKTEEREDGEENYLTDTNSQDSCKETGEADEGSGEENCVEE
ncbi:hypothetical protein J1605_023118 [Eschrichtius robustus]|uniref:Protein FAM161A n=1 Tax=Eschrichtius robustus TaxID=9764 RepID=A0AB34H7N2_ESCRO|nr:hypothetical protein J1605_023118 [Eschrichtius robustus]